MKQLGNHNASDENGEILSGRFDQFLIEYRKLTPDDFPQVECDDPIILYGIKHFSPSNLPPMDYLIQRLSPDLDVNIHVSRRISPIVQIAVDIIIDRLGM